MYKKYNKFDIANMKMAFITADLSYALRRKVGAIIVDENRVIANGYNGTITGTDNTCEDKVLYCPKCKEIHIISPSSDISNSDTRSYEYICNNCGTQNKYNNVSEFLELKTNNRVIHAEQNALLFAARKGISVKGATMYVTSAPCIECAKAIAESGIKMVIWKEVYKDLAGPELLNDVGVECYRYDIIDQPV